jgi:methyltransferase (TIGR00027 family)
METRAGGATRLNEVLTVSDTAYAAATVRALEDGRPDCERLFVDPYATIFRAAGAHVREETQRLIELPLVIQGVRLRTRFLDDVVRQELDSGTRQLVLLGAGFDMRGLRLPQVSAHGARVYEVDFAELLDRKRSLLTAARVELPGHVVHVPCDLMSADLEPALMEALDSKGYRRDTRTLFVWEGVTPYIDDAAIERSLRFVATAGAPGSRLCFDYADVRFDPVPAAHRVKRAGFTQFESVAFDALWKQYLQSEPDPFASWAKIGIATR